MLELLKNKSKNWYHVNDEVEYSTIYRFFLDNQLLVSRSNNIISFSSRLDGTLFKELTLPFRNGESEDSICREIHKNLLNGKYYKNGKFIN